MADAATITVMDALLDAATDQHLPLLGSLVEGKVIDIVGNKILVDLNGIATGMISGKEARDTADTLKTLQSGDDIASYVIDEENEDGYFILSLRRASQEKMWQKFVDSYNNNTILQVTVSEANKGGLLVIMDGIKAFIPVSQLAPAHYPRVDDANSAEILNRLKKLSGKELSVKILTINRDEGKLILSEKAAIEEDRKSALLTLSSGDVVDGKVSGIVKFGIFVAFEGLEGLVHISEIEWGHVKDPSTYAKVGDPVRAKVIGIDGDKISLSMKQLSDDPWKNVEDRFKIGDLVSGAVDRITQFGVFLKLDNHLSGLVHLSELAHEPVKDANDILNIGDKIDAKVIAIDTADRRIGLSIKALTEASEGTETPPEPEPDTEEPSVESEEKAQEEAK
jgi:small subunit ribosomal protein S1